MKGHRYKKNGWYGESYRHYLAAKGVKTNKYFQTRSALAQGIESFGTDLRKRREKQRRQLLDPTTLVKPAQSRSDMTRERIQTALTPVEMEMLEARSRALGASGTTLKDVWQTAAAQQRLEESLVEYEPKLEAMFKKANAMANQAETKLKETEDPLTGKPSAEELEKAQIAAGEARRQRDVLQEELFTLRELISDVNLSEDLRQRNALSGNRALKVRVLNKAVMATQPDLAELARKGTRIRRERSKQSKETFEKREGGS